VKRAFDLYLKDEANTGRVGFARLFDPRIPADAKSRDVENNRTYNKLNYLIDKVYKRAHADEGAEDAEVTKIRLSIEERRHKIQTDWIRFKKSYKSRTITVDAVEALLTTVLAELWPEKKVKDVLVA
jgi:hypothetical protein